MFEQLTELIQHYGNEAVVKNDAVPNEQNEAVLQEAHSSILSGLQQMASGGNLDALAGLLKGNSSVDSSNPVVQKLTEQFSGNLGSKFGLDSAAASGVAGGLIPKVLSALFGKANDSNDSSFQVSDIVKAISGNGNSGLMDAVSKYGMQFGLDENHDGKVDLSDAMDAVNKNGGVGSLLGKLFGK